MTNKKESIVFVQMETSKKDNSVICRIDGKISFIDRKYRGLMPQSREAWLVEVVASLEKVNIIRPICQAKDADKKLMEEWGFCSFTLDLLRGELTCCYFGGGGTVTIPYDGRFDNEMLPSFGFLRKEVYSDNMRVEDAFAIIKKAQRRMQDEHDDVVINTGGGVVVLHNNNLFVFYLNSKEEYKIKSTTVIYEKIAVFLQEEDMDNSFPEYLQEVRDTIMKPSHSSYSFIAERDIKYLDYVFADDEARTAFINYLSYKPQQSSQPSQRFKECLEKLHSAAKLAHGDIINKALQNVRKTVTDSALIDKINQWEEQEKKDQAAGNYFSPLGELGLIYPVAGDDGVGYDADGDYCPIIVLESDGRYLVINDPDEEESDVEEVSLEKAVEIINSFFDGSVDQYSKIIADIFGVKFQNEE